MGYRTRVAELTPRTRKEIERVHRRYLIEVVEELGLCPFARKSRELGRVHRPVFPVKAGEPEPGQVATTLHGLVKQHPDAEIVLLTFVTSEGHPWERTKPFDAWVKRLRDAWQSLETPRFYMVGFHPRYTVEAELTPDTLVQLIRRSPDPVVQCVNASVLDRVKAQSREQARQRFLASLDTDFPSLDAATRQVLARSVQTESELSRDIANRNFQTVGQGGGLERFEHVVNDILEDRQAVKVKFQPDEPVR